MPFAASRVLGTLARLVDAVYLQGDGEHGSDTSGTRFDAGSSSRAPGVAYVDTGSWACEAEPVPCAIDTWARGSVPTKRREPVTAESSVAEPSLGEEKGVEARASPATRPKPKGTAIPTREKSRSVTGLNPMEFTQSPRLVAVPQDAVATQEQAVRARVLAEARKREAENDERKRKAEAEAAAEAEANERLKRDLKGKAFTTDDTGAVVIVRRVNHSRIPPPFQPVDIVRVAGGEPEAAPVAVSPSRTRLPKDAGRSRPKLDDLSQVTEGGRESSEVYFEKSTLVQPPLAETIKLAPGVVLKEGGSVIEGPKSDNKVAGRMSRGDFLQHQSSLSQTAASIRDADIGTGLVTAALEAGASEGDGPSVRDPKWGDNSPVLAEPAAAPLKSRKPTTTQRFLAQGTKPRGPRDRPYVSTTQTTSSRAAVVSHGMGSGSPSGTEHPADGPDTFGMSMEDGSLVDASLLQGTKGGSVLNDSLMFPAIPGAEGAGAKGKARRGEWGETALRKHAGSLQVTQKGLELLKLAPS